MAKKSSAPTKKSSDRKRVSAQKHEISYTGRKVAKKAGVSIASGKKAVKQAKKRTGTVKRSVVEPAATKKARKA